jgi:hypothetical protein
VLYTVITFLLSFVTLRGRLLLLVVGPFYANSSKASADTGELELLLLDVVVVFVNY